jgi:hypothetical protein
MQLAGAGTGPTFGHVYIKFSQKPPLMRASALFPAVFGNPRAGCRSASKAVMQINNYVQALRHSFVLDKGKTTERWRRKVTGLEGLRPYGSGTARRLQ